MTKQEPPATGVLVVGGGAAGLVAGTEAAYGGAEVLVLERGSQAGVKILMSGGGHCNVTTSLSPREGARHFGEAERWLRPALRAVTPELLRSWLREEGVETYEAEFDKVWPVSMKARDVRDALLRRLEKSGARLRYGLRLRGLQRATCGAWSLLAESGESFLAERVVLATGGLSYPQTGTEGDGFAMLESLGVELRPRVPALAPLASDAAWVGELSGLTLEGCEVQLREASGKIAWRRRRPLLFTHKGVSGPGPMDASSRIERMPGRYRFFVDLLPERSEEELRVALFAQGGKLASPLRALGLPKRLVWRILDLLGLAVVDAAQVPKAKRRALAATLKGLEIPVTGSLGFGHAELTAGGVPLDAVDPRSMELRAQPGLHVCGELLDADGPIGGFSFWQAFATGALAGRAAAAALC